MISESGFGSLASVAIERSPTRNQIGSELGGLTFRGQYHFDIYDKHGNFLRSFDSENTVLLPAIDDILNKYLRNGTTPAAWYMGLVSNTGFTTFANTDTMASHAGWSETILYAGSARPAWAPAASTGNANASTNGTQVSFTINTDNTPIRGAFICSDSTLSGTAGILLSTTSFVEGVQTLNNGDVAKVTYTITGAPV